MSVIKRKLMMMNDDEKTAATKTYGDGRASVLFWSNSTQMARKSAQNIKRKKMKCGHFGHRSKWTQPRFGPGAQRSRRSWARSSWARYYTLGPTSIWTRSVSGVSSILCRFLINLSGAVGTAVPRHQPRPLPRVRIWNVGFDV